MRKIVSVVWLIIMSGIGFSLFNCTTETCMWNGTSNKWDCHYIGCPIKPDFIRNETVIKTYTINVTTINYTCNDSKIIHNLTGQLNQINQRYDELNQRYDELLKDYNNTDKYANMYANWKSCTEAYQEILNSTKNTVPITKYMNCTNEISILHNRIDTEKSRSTRNFGIGFVVGAIAVYLYLRRPSIEKRHYETIPGITRYNVDALERDIQSEKKKHKGGKK